MRNIGFLTSKTLNVELVTIPKHCSWECSALVETCSIWSLKSKNTLSFIFLRKTAVLDWTLSSLLSNCFFLQSWFWENLRSSSVAAFPSFTSLLMMFQWDTVCEMHLLCFYFSSMLMVTVFCNFSFETFLTVKNAVLKIYSWSYLA